MDEASSPEAMFTNQEDRETFIQSLYYFTDTKTGKSTNKTVKNLSVIIKLAKKLNIKYMHDEKITTGAVLKAIAEISMKNNIHFALAVVNPALPFLAKTSELINIYRPLLERPLDQAFQEAKRALENPPADQSVIDRHCHAINNTLIASGCVLGKVVLRAVTSPDDLCSAIAEAYVDTSAKGVSFLGRGAHALGEGIDRSARFVRGQVSSAADAFKPTLEVLPFIDAGCPEHVQKILERQRNSRAEPETDNLHHDEGQSQPTALQEEEHPPVRPASEEQEGTSAAEQPEREPGASVPAATRTCSTLQTPVWINFNRPHPLTQILSGSLCISGGLGTRPTYAVQVNVRITGGSITTPPQIQSALNTKTTGGGQNTGSLRIHPEDQNKHVYKPIEEKHKAWSEALNDYNTKKSALVEAQNSFSSDDSFETYTAKCNEVIAKKRDLEPAAQKVMNAAYDVHKLTRNEARREYRRDWKVNDQRIADLNDAVKNQLWSEFGVPQQRELRRRDLAASGTLRALGEIETAYTSSLGQAKRTHQQMLKRQEEIAQNRTDTACKNQEFETLHATIRAMENSDGPVDPHVLSGAIAALKLLGDQLLTLARDKARLDPVSMAESDIAALQTHMGKTIAELTHRDARYVKIVGDYQQFCNAYVSLLPKFIDNADREGIHQNLMEMHWQTGALESLILELISQCPDKRERNAELQRLLEDITSKSSDLTFCALSFDDKFAGIQSLKEQIRSSSSPEHHARATDACHKRYGVLLHQLQASGDHAKFSGCFNQFLDFLLKEDALSDWDVGMILDLSSFIRKAVVAKQIPLEKTIQLLEALENQVAYRPAHSDNPLEAVDLSPLRITIGELMTCSEQSTGTRARMWYEKCKRLQPDQPHWSRAIAACHLETLHWSLAEQSLLEVLAKNPGDENTGKAVAALVSDKYQSASLVLEWIQTLTSMEVSQELGRLEPFLSGFLKTVNTSTSLLTHPGLLKKWLPSALPLPDQFRPHLATLLSNDSSTDFTACNIATLALKLVTIGSSLVKNSVTKEKHPFARDIAERASYGAQGLQQLLTAGSGMLRLKSGASALMAKYRSNSFQHSDLFSVAGSLSLPVIQHMPLAIPLLQGLVYKDKQAKKRSQQAHPCVHAVIETLGSRNFAATATVTDLMLRSSRLASRALARFSGVRPSKIERVLRGMVAGYFLFSSSMAILRAWTQIRQSRHRQDLH